MHDGVKVFGFIAESVFTIIPESCSGSPRNSVRNHPGIAFTLDRIPHNRIPQNMDFPVTSILGEILLAFSCCLRLRTVRNRMGLV